MTESGYIVVGAICLLDIIAIILCHKTKEYETRDISIFILVILIGILLYGLSINLMEVTK
jgi:hypothetical protein